MSQTQEILEYWFTGWNDRTPQPADDPLKVRWWGGGPDLDAEIRSRFMDAHFKAAAREWPTDTPEDAVANILLLDQVPRNAFRGTPHMFATDRLAQAATRTLMESPMWVSVPFIHRYFALMPLMHAEDLGSHELAVQAFEELVEATRDLPRADTYANGLDYEHRHMAIVARFGRYPHRNACLGRHSTADELAFLKEPGSSF